jgi:hypothetical protein
MPDCSKCKKPTASFPITKSGKPSLMCKPCYEWQKAWNADKHKATKALTEAVPAGQRFCMRCRKYKPEDEFKTNPKQRRKIEQGQYLSRDCSSCRDKMAVRVTIIRHENHKDPAVKAKYLEGRRNYSRQFRLKLIEAYGGHCICCGETEPKFLELDHVDGGGGKHRKQIGAGAEPLYRWCVKNGFPNTLQLICANCHNAKSSWGECPHKKVSVLQLAVTA